MTDFSKIIRTHTNREFSQSVYLDGYRAVDAQFEFHERVGYPYAICALRCIQQVQEWMAKAHPNDEVMFVFEKGDSHQSKIIDFLRRDGIDLGIDPIFMEKRWVVGGSARTFPPLECADFLAYEHHKVLTDLYLKQKTTARGSLWNLTGQGEFFRVKGRGNPVSDGLFFETLARGMNLPRRHGVPETPIPHEQKSLGEQLKGNFHGTPPRSLRIQSRREPLPRLRRS